MAGRGRGRGAYYRAKYGGGGRQRGHDEYFPRDGENVSEKRSRTIRGNQEELASWLHAHDNGPYPAYHDMEGTWTFDGFTFTLDHAQADPYATPSKARVKVSHSYARFPGQLRDTTLRRIALADYLLRSLYRVCTSKSYDEKLQGGGWSGAKGGQIQVDAPGQQVLERSAVMMDDEGIEVRFALGLPARGRSIMGRLAATVCA